MNEYVVAAIAVFVMMNIASFFAIHFRRNDIADVVWGPGFLIAGLALFLFKSFKYGALDLDSRVLCVLVMVGTWALRLFFHIGLRNLKSTHEDARYAKMRAGWGDSWRLNSYFKVFWLQGVLMYIIGLAMFIVIASPSQKIGIETYVGVAFWVFGFAIESISDAQLASFKKDPKNKLKIMDLGLWSWSRHPNYFGEVVQWWGIFLLCLPLPYGWIGILSPISISFLILKVSGVPMLEKQMQNRPGFQEYRARTSEFILWPPRQKA